MKRAIRGCLAGLLMSVCPGKSAKAQTNHAPERHPVRDTGTGPTLELLPEWRRADAVNVMVVGSATTGALMTLMVPAPETEADWRGPVMFDSFFRDGMVMRSRRGRNLADTVSDIALYGSVAHVLLDATLVASVKHRAPDVGFEMLMMDAEAYSVSLLLNSVTKRLTSRARPQAESCEQDPTYETGCQDSAPYVSFYSGHAAMTATSAGLLCAQHSELDLYGSGWDGAACATAIALTSVTGGLRIAADRHWASDVVTGHILGFSAGYFIPKLWHFDRPAVESSGADGLMGVVPMPMADGLALVALGTF
jgi:hypothetical protein